MPEPAVSPDPPLVAANNNYGADHPESVAGWRSYLSHSRAIAILEDASLQIDEVLDWLRKGLVPASLGVVLRPRQTLEARRAPEDKAAPQQR
ncbi:MAG TPA: hypothetical protein VH353_13470 [Caulobacteraceae bacterium]|jgi:hypothetical protein|nr:hypothetical protein [Caulobacteraceae bacterium]